MQYRSWCGSEATADAVSAAHSAARTPCASPRDRRYRRPLPSAVAALCAELTASGERHRMPLRLSCPASRLRAENLRRNLACLEFTCRSGTADRHVGFASQQWRDFRHSQRCSPQREEGRKTFCLIRAALSVYFTSGRSASCRASNLQDFCSAPLSGAPTLTMRRRMSKRPRSVRWM